MGKVRRNVFRHIFIFFLSFVILVPVAVFFNKNYYATISKVNYFEEKQIRALLQFILKNVNVEDVKSDLNDALSEIRWLGVTIKKDDIVIIDKGIKNAEIDIGYKGVHNINDYEVIIRRRKYPGYFYDYKRYIRSLFPWNEAYWNPALRKKHIALGDYTEVSIYLVNKTIFATSNLRLFISQLAIFFFLETIFLLISVKYRFRTIKDEIDKLKIRMFKS
jgi:hypothetical protein